MLSLSSGHSQATAPASRSPSQRVFDHAGGRRTIKRMNDMTISTTLSLTELEEAINYWRIQRPATGEECALSPEVNALADVYALMIIDHAHAVDLDAVGKEPRQLIDTWRKARTPQNV